ncbi:MAG TPA: ATP-binding protein, partial [Chroococcidiopsis sp.]
MLIGLPGSGKSTLTRQLLDHQPRQIIVSTDAIRAQLFGDEAIQGPWPLVWQELQRQLTRAIADIQAGHCLGVIYDATNAVRRNRRAVLDLARSLGFSPIVALWLDLPLAVCQTR